MFTLSLSLYPSIHLSLYPSIIIYLSIYLSLSLPPSLSIHWNPLHCCWWNSHIRVYQRISMPIIPSSHSIPPPTKKKKKLRFRWWNPNVSSGGSAGDASIRSLTSVKAMAKWGLHHVDQTSESIPREMGKKWAWPISVSSGWNRCPNPMAYHNPQQIGYTIGNMGKTIINHPPNQHK